MEFTAHAYDHPDYVRGFAPASDLGADCACSTCDPDQMWRWGNCYVCTEVDPDNAFYDRVEGRSCGHPQKYQTGDGNEDARPSERTIARYRNQIAKWNADVE